MKYQTFGKSGLRVSEICLGAMTFGKQHDWCASKEESKKIFDCFVEAGGNFIDTANTYTGGTSEKYVGEFVGNNRDRYVIATKYTISMFPNDPNGGGNHRKNIIQSVEASLKRLKTDYIDLYWLHCWDYLTPIDEVMRAFDDLVRSGKILYAGISNTPAWIVAQGNTVAELRGWSRFVGLQVEYSLVQRTVEFELLPMAKHFEIEIAAWSPLGMGLLAGKYTRRKKAKGSRRLEQISDVELNEHNLSIARTVDEIADELGCSSAQVALNWLRRKKNVIPIIGARKLSQIQDNLNCLNFSLADEHLEKLDKVSQPSPIFPNVFFQREHIRKAIHGQMVSQIKNFE